MLPIGESLKMAVHRVLPYWYDEICPKILAGKNVIVVAHRNSLRAIILHLNGINEENLINFNVPTACPLVYEFDDLLNPVHHYYLTDK